MANKISFWVAVIMVCLAMPLIPADKLSDFIRVLEDNGMIEEAITEYKRHLFLNRLNDEEEGMIWLKLAVCYREINHDAEMMKAFDQSFVHLENSPALQDLYLELAVFYLARGKTSWARLFLQKITRRTQAQAVKKYMTISYLIDQDWDRFFLLLGEKDIREPVISEIRKLVQEMKKNSRRMKTLIILDFLLPGIGYVCQADMLEGGESLLFHSFFVYQILIESSWPGKIVFGWSLSRLYLKSISKSRQYIKEKIHSRKMLLEEKIFEKLSNLAGD